MRKNIIKLSEEDIRNIIKESVNKILTEELSTQDTIQELEDIVGYRFDESEPVSFIDDFYNLLINITQYDYNENNGLSNDFLDYRDTKGLHIQDIEHYIPILRQTLDECMRNLYQQLQQQMEEGNNILNKCVRLITQVKQNQKPKPYDMQ